MLITKNNKMKTNINRTITTTQEAKDFLTELFNNDEHYHFDESAADIIDMNSERCFSDAEALELDKLNDEITSLDEICANGFLLELMLKK